MSKSKVYFSDFHTIALGDGIPKKLYKLVKAAGIPVWMPACSQNRSPAASSTTTCILRDLRTITTTSRTPILKSNGAHASNRQKRSASAAGNMT